MGTEKLVLPLVRWKKPIEHEPSAVLTTSSADQRILLFVGGTCGSILLYQLHQFQLEAKMLLLSHQKSEENQKIVGLVQCLTEYAEEILVAVDVGGTLCTWDLSQNQSCLSCQPKFAATIAPISDMQQLYNQRYILLSGSLNRTMIVDIWEMNIVSSFASQDLVVKNISTGQARINTSPSSSAAEGTTNASPHDSVHWNSYIITLGSFGLIQCSMWVKPRRINDGDSSNTTSSITNKSHKAEGKFDHKLWSLSWEDVEDEQGKVYCSPAASCNLVSDCSEELKSKNHVKYHFQINHGNANFNNSSSYRNNFPIAIHLSQEIPSNSQSRTEGDSNLLLIIWKTKWIVIKRSWLYSNHEPQSISTGDKKPRFQAIFGSTLQNPQENHKPTLKVITWKDGKFIDSNKKIVLWTAKGEFYMFKLFPVVDNEMVETKNSVVILTVQSKQACIIRNVLSVDKGERIDFNCDRKVSINRKKTHCRNPLALFDAYYSTFNNYIYCAKFLTSGVILHSFPLSTSILNERKVLTNSLNLNDQRGYSAQATCSQLVVTKSHLFNCNFEVTSATIEKGNRDDAKVNILENIPILINGYPDGRLQLSWFGFQNDPSNDTHEGSTFYEYHGKSGITVLETVMIDREYFFDCRTVVQQNIMEQKNKKVPIKFRQMESRLYEGFADANKRKKKRLPQHIEELSSSPTKMSGLIERVQGGLKHAMLQSSTTLSSYTKSTTKNMDRKDAGLSLEKGESIIADTNAVTCLDTDIFVLSGDAHGTFVVSQLILSFHSGRNEMKNRCKEMRSCCRPPLTQSLRKLKSWQSMHFGSISKIVACPQLYLSTSNNPASCNDVTQLKQLICTVGTRDRRVVLYSISNNIDEVKYVVKKEAIFEGHEEEVIQVSWKLSQDCFLVECRNNMIYAWNISTGLLERVLPKSMIYINPHTNHNEERRNSSNGKETKASRELGSSPVEVIQSANESFDLIFYNLELCGDLLKKKWNVCHHSSITSPSSSTLLNSLEESVFAFLYLWKKDLTLDSLATQLLGILDCEEKVVGGASIAYSFGLKGPGDSIAILLPQQLNNFDDNVDRMKWFRHSSALTSLLLLSMVSVCMNLMNMTQDVKLNEIEVDDHTLIGERTENLEKMQIFWSRLVTFYSIIVPEEIQQLGSQYYEPNLEILARYGLSDEGEHTNTAARLLLNGCISRLSSPDEISRVAASWAAKLHCSIMSIVVKLQLKVQKSSTAKKQLKSDIMDNSVVTSQAILVDLITSKLSLADQLATSIGEHVGYMILVLSSIGVISPQHISPSTARQVCDLLLIFLHGSPLQAILACEQLAKAFPLWRPHLENLTNLVNQLVYLTICHSNKNMGRNEENNLNQSNVGSKAHKLNTSALRVLIEIGACEPDLFLCIAKRESTSNEHSDRFRNGLLTAVMELVFSHYLLLSRHLPFIVEIILACLDPTKPERRKKSLNLITKSLHELVLKFPFVAFHKTTQRLAVGTIDNALIIIYDLRTATKWRVLDGHTSPISALTFSSNGEMLISYSCREIPKNGALSCGSVRYWRCGKTGFFDMLSMQEKCIKTIHLDEVSSGVNCDLKEIIRHCRFQLIKDDKTQVENALLTRENLDKLLFNFQL